MRRLIGAVLLAFVVTSPVAAASAPPPGLAGTLAVVSSTPTTVTLHAEQTGGSPVTLLVEHFCYQGNVYADDSVYAGMERVRFTGSADVTFNIGPRTRHGREVVPTECWALLEFNFSSSRVAILARADTLP